MIIGAGVGSVVTEWRRLWRLRQRAHERDEARDLLHSHGTGKGRAFCEKLAQQAGIDQSHPALQRWYASIHETQNDREVVSLYAHLVQPVLDARARREISRSAAESTLMIAVSPLALVDMAFIARRNLRLINRIATLYGIELGYYSRLRLFKLVLLNIAFAGASELVREVGMDWMSQDLAARLSTRAAQGIGAGLLTARLGIKAMELCRPLPWIDDDKPRLGDFRRQLIGQVKETLQKAKRPAKNNAISGADRISLRRSARFSVFVSMIVDRNLPAIQIVSYHHINCSFFQVKVPMRLEVFCEDRLGLTRELLDLLVLRGIDLRGIEIDPIGRIYLNFAELEFESFSSLMAEIRRIAGVTDVRTVPWMPSEREHLALSALLEALPEPVLSVDMKSKVDMANPASCQLFGQKLDRLRNHTAAQLINGFNFLRWLESEPQDSHNEHVVINGQNFLMEITPVYLQDENDQHVLTGAVVMLRSTIRMGRQLQNVAAQDVSAFSQIVAVSPKMKHVVEQAQKLAMLSAPLLITGDTGTGKDLFAYACHQASPRAGKPYPALNCASIPEDAVESELFGHAPEGKKGFFEQANGGSVLLDEIGEMSPRMQAKLLRFLNDGTFRRVGEDHEVHVDVRVICATQKNLVELVQKGMFREDLYYRLNVLTLNLPPLRDCPQDIMPLTELFVARFADEQGVPRPKLAADLNTVLTRYAWPGNVRQLKNAIYRALTQLDGYELRPQDILLPDYDAATVAVGEDAMEGSLDEITSRFERSVLTQLYRNYPSTRKLAKRLGVSHTAIANKLREYGLSQKKNEE